MHHKFHVDSVSFSFQVIPGIFCSGLQITELYQKTPDFYREFWHSIQEFWLRLYGSPLAVIAAINVGIIFFHKCASLSGIFFGPEFDEGLVENNWGYTGISLRHEQNAGVEGTATGKCREKWRKS